VQQQARLTVMRVTVEVIDAVGMKGTGATDQAMDCIALGEEELGQIRSALAGHAGDKGFFHGWVGSVKL